MTATRYQRADLGGTFLPVGQMLQIDRVCEVAEERIVCEMDLDAGHWAFPMHFPGDPIFPGSLLIEAAGQVVALWAWDAGLRGRPRMAKVSAEFETPVLADDVNLTFSATVRRRRNICLGRVEIHAGARRIGTVEPVIVVLSDDSA